MFFGEYLIQRGLITEEDVREALGIQTSERKNIGQLAVKVIFADQPIEALKGFKDLRKRF